MNSSEARLFAMIGGWIMAFWGAHRRDWPGTITAMIGLGIAGSAMAIGDRKH